MRPRPATLLRTTVAAVAALVLAGCGQEGDGPATTGGQAGLSVLAGFYPLEFVAARVGGERIAVSSMTPPGVEAHDLELSPRDVAGVSDADLVIYLAGFQPAVDDAVAQQAPDSALEVGEVAGLDVEAGDHDHADGEHADTQHGDDGHGDDGQGDDGQGDASADPHFWLDPTKLAAVAEATAERLAELDPAGEAEYRDNAATLTADLDALDKEMGDALATCETRTMVVSHEAFGYLAARYDLDQVGIAGLTPDEEPSASQMADLVRFVRDNEVRTVYYETLVSPDVAETVAAEAGVDTAVLDPIEGLTADAAGSDYLEVMRANLAALQAGQPCP